ncbi:MAG: hypothetical protein KAJ40_00120 [Alphaproteobacteria bacterium]|nr:hypothetical protein [Alphaproteobacteria bacterium]
MVFNQADRAYPKPQQIASVKKVREAWSDSNDSRGSGGARGIDGETAYTFKGRLETNFREINRQLVDGTFEFKKLKAFPIEKNGGGHRIICIPTIRDRLVQRLILRSLTWDSKYVKERDRLKTNTTVSYGVRKGREQSVHGAINAAIKYRDQYKWVVKTDISKFFDQIPRAELKKLVGSRLGASSLVPLIEKAIDCELEIPRDKDLQGIISDNGIKSKVGLRQGMPLSPLLSNLILNKFDRKVESRGLKLVRYADDIIAFASDEDEANQIFSFVEEELRKEKLGIPALGTGDKSVIVPPNEDVTFLGVSIYRQRNGKYNRKIPDATFERAKLKVRDHKDLAWNNKKGYSYADVIRRLKDIPEGYGAAFGDCTNLGSLLDLLKKEGDQVKQTLISSIFGEEVYARLSDQEKDFLGF